jgi:hypothetical protein
VVPVEGSGELEGLMELYASESACPQGGLVVKKYLVQWGEECWF